MCCLTNGTEVQWYNFTLHTYMYTCKLKGTRGTKSVRLQPYFTIPVHYRVVGRKINADVLRLMFALGALNAELETAIIRCTDWGTSWICSVPNSQAEFHVFNRARDCSKSIPRLSLFRRWPWTWIYCSFVLCTDPKCGGGEKGPATGHFKPALFVQARDLWTPVLTHWPRTKCQRLYRYPTEVILLIVELGRQGEAQRSQLRYMYMRSPLLKINAGALQVFMDRINTESAKMLPVGFPGRGGCPP